MIWSHVKCTISAAEEGIVDGRWARTEAERPVSRFCYSQRLWSLK